MSRYTFNTNAACYWPEIDVIASVEAVNVDTGRTHTQELTMPWRVAKELAEKMLRAAEQAEQGEREYELKYGSGF